MNKDWIIYLCGIHSFGFAVFHMFFWRLFRWKTGLNTISKPNKGILQIANVQLICLLLFVAYLCFFFTADLYQTGLGKALLAGFAFFWFLRTVQQFIFLRINHWMVHLLTVFFVIGTVLFLMPLV